MCLCVRACACLCISVCLYSCGCPYPCVICVWLLSKLTCVVTQPPQSSSWADQKLIAPPKYTASPSHYSKCFGLVGQQCPSNIVQMIIDNHPNTATKDLEYTYVLGCPKKSKSPNFGMPLTPIVFIGKMSHQKKNQHYRPINDTWRAIFSFTL